MSMTQSILNYYSQFCTTWDDCNAHFMMNKYNLLWLREICTQMIQMKFYLNLFSWINSF